MENKLLPCPFCGGEAETTKWPEGWFIECKDQRCGGTIGAYKTEQEAIESWNTRAERTCKMKKVFLYDDECVEGIECSECGWSDVHDHDDLMPERCPNCGRKVQDDD